MTTQLSDEAVRELYERLRPYPSESEVSECLKELLELRTEVADLKHDLERSMANHVADINAHEPREEYGECPTCRCGTVDHGKRVHAEGCPELNRGAE